MIYLSNPLQQELLRTSMWGFWIIHRYSVLDDFGGTNGHSLT